jgi:hypothetical protein
VIWITVTSVSATIQGAFVECKIRLMKRLRLLGYSALALFGAAIISGGLVLFGLLQVPGANISETMLVLNDVNGAGFEVIYTNSDTLAKEEWVNVYVYDSGSRSTWLNRLMHRKTLLFSYDPGYPALTPRIEAAGPGNVRISIPRVSSVLYQGHQWKGLSVDYQIAKVDYP